MATHCSILPKISHGQRSLAGYSPKDCKELDMTEWLSVRVRTHTHTHENKSTDAYVWKGYKAGEIIEENTLMKMMATLVKKRCRQ